MELLAGFAVLAAVVAGLLLVLKVSLWITALVLLPVLWVWMLVDALVRCDEEYPSRSANEKVLRIVLMLVLPISVPVYWFMVYRSGKRQDVTGAGSTQLAVAAVPAALTPPSAA